MRVRIDAAANYRAIFTDSMKTLRTRIDPTKPISAPATPELEDVAINSRCNANCPYCYVSAVPTGKDFHDIVRKAEEVWGAVEMNLRPFQIAIGGAGEPTMHKDFPDFVGAVKRLGIVPNYTTNGMHLTETVLKATEAHCGGVAVSYHPHIQKAFWRAVEKLTGRTGKLNAHVIVGEPGSLDNLKRVADARGLDYVVVLPYQAAGRAAEVDTLAVWDETFDWIASNDPERFAFGALFWEWMKGRKMPFKLSLYEPEIYSGYRIMDETYKTLRVSSYNTSEK